MNSILKLAAALIAPLASCAAALPDRKDVFTIASYSPQVTNFISADFIYSALSSYVVVTDRTSVNDYPSHKNSSTQQGVIVLRDQRVLFFETRSSKYLEVRDAGNQVTFYRLPAGARPRLKCPGAPGNLSKLDFPLPNDVFCIALHPFSRGTHFTPESLRVALPRFRVLTKEDVPTLAVRAIDMELKRETYSPAEWTTPQGRTAEVLNGVVVLKNGAVLKWITWTPTAIAFSNYRYGSYYVLNGGNEKDGPR